MDKEIEALLYDIFDDDEDEFFDLLVVKAANEAAIAAAARGRVNQDGSDRKVNREDYSRGPKIRKFDDPMETNWMQLLHNPETADPKSRCGKEFRRKFRVPLPVFKDIVEKCKATGDALFCVPAVHFTGQHNIPL